MVPIKILISLSLLFGVDSHGDVAYVYLCQKHNSSLENCYQSVNMLWKESISVIFSQKYNVKADWIIFPIFDMFNPLPNWVMFCTEYTQVNSKKLMKILETLNPENDVFLGRGLLDQIPVIIHHFSMDLNFKYPLLPAGFLISRPLFEKIHAKLRKGKWLEKMIDFTIDPSYEFARVVSQFGGELIHSEQFCIEYGEDCATVVLPQPNRRNFKADLNSILFGVKTCNKYHKDRLPIVHTTWAKDTKFIFYYSDSVNQEIPTVVIKSRKTEFGHCEKTFGIIQDMREKFSTDKNLKWAVIADDDTLLSVERIVKLVQNYNYSEPLALGERYGYNLLKREGYEYLTAGSGVILSRAALKKYERNYCDCPTHTTPDDMFLFGVCFIRLGIQLIHIPTMHQARPVDYNPDYLAIGKPISFHKHYMIDPKQVYQKWLI